MYWQGGVVGRVIECPSYCPGDPYSKTQPLGMGIDRVLAAYAWSIDG